MVARADRIISRDDVRAGHGLAAQVTLRRCGRRPVAETGLLARCA
jgi:hypothetical protein